MRITKMRFVKFEKVNRDFAEKLFLSKKQFRKICRLQNLEIVLTWIHEKTNGGKEFWDNLWSFIFP